MRRWAGLLATAAVASPAAAAPAGDTALLTRHHVTVVERDVRLPDCRAFGATSEGELASTVVDVRARVPFPNVDERQRYTGRAAFTIERITVRIPRNITWPGMTERDRRAAASAVAALRHHEAGHVRVAVEEVARLNALAPTVSADPEVYRRTVTRRGRDGLAALAASQRAYDDLTDHGRSQDKATGTLYGPRTELACVSEAGERSQ